MNILALILSILMICAHINILQPDGMEKIYKDDLEEALAGASTENSTVIIAVANQAYTEGDKPMLDIFLDGLWLGEGTQKLKDHILIVAVDQTAYDRCKFLNLHCYKMKTDGVEFDGREKLFMSDDFIKMMWRRTLLLGDVLKHGYNFIFTDMDILWVRNPFQMLMLNESLDLQISVDKFNGDEWSENNPINTGFYMIRSNRKTIALYDEWYGQKDNSTGKKEQDVLYELMRGGAFERLGLRVRFLDTLFFSGFCQNSNDFKEVTTVHANCCRSIKAKVHDLMEVLHDWKKFKASSHDNTTQFQWSDHTACLDSWKQQ
ncbi:nucleotide-diphospho-sugar transferase [Artemisia annua]|uniref:Nucleotide-diphospho-sugar transferase n=1 Tax=Artemisia annua TaxID=35608 RepID=A0A2U1NTH5_ARTAN|nr:nucleotide-diphospho-sugar transferase [Artemisia annua]